MYWADQGPIPSPAHQLAVWCWASPFKTLCLFASMGNSPRALEASDEPREEAWVSAQHGMHSAGTWQRASPWQGPWWARDAQRRVLELGDLRTGWGRSRGREDAGWDHTCVTDSGGALGETAHPGGQGSRKPSDVAPPPCQLGAQSPPCHTPSADCAARPGRHSPVSLTRAAFVPGFIFPSDRYQSLFTWCSPASAK